MAITAKKTPTQELARFLAMYEPGIAATARAALMPPFFTDGACTAEFDNVARQIQENKLSLASLRRPKNIGMPRMFQYRRFRRPSAESRGLASSIAAPRGICYWCPSPSTTRFAISTGIPLSEFNFDTTIKGG